jgi:hypothetical protein
MHMEAVDTIEEKTEGQPHLEKDARWQLVQRIVGSRTMRRATHLQRILLFVAKASLLQPDCIVREQDIALRVLGRKDDFDPAYDTIVRVQIGHLRLKLKSYFENEGASEPLHLTLPRGSYRTIFEEAAAGQKTEAEEPPTRSVAEPLVTEQSPLVAPPASHYPMRTPRFWVAIAVILLCATAISLLWWRSHRTASSDSSITARMFPYLAKGGGKVAVVLPDTSLLLIQRTLDTEISVETYTQTTSRTELAQQAKEQQLGRFMAYLGRTRTTTLDEASVGMDFLQALTRSGMQGELRYTRDLHIRDFGQGSYILIGNQRSDPWVSLFMGKSNFQYRRAEGRSYVFHNVNPANGELLDYAPVESEAESINYADVTLTPNFTDSGYVLTIVGSDVPANEAAARFLMGDELPQELQSILKNRNLRSFELLLRGHHLHGESNDKLAIVAYRVTNR